MKRRVIVLGSTGSIGCSALEVLAAMRDEFRVVGLAAGSRAAKLAEQANRYRPESVAIAAGKQAAALSGALAYGPRLFSGRDALVTLLEETPCDCVVASVVGATALAATVRAVELGRRVALANKESLVVAGGLLVELARRNNASIIPVDSEHSAIFQAMRAGAPREVRRVYLTSSGGPFRTWSRQAMEGITADRAMRHPTWEMGPKISIDSATMMNKALEIVEAKWLFNLTADQIEVVIHPEAIVHSIVEFCDGSLIAQLGTPDMRTPIQYALTHPDRRPCPSERLELSRLGRLTLERPDLDRFPALRLGYMVAEREGTSGAVLNGANEAAVELFRDGAIHYLDIARHTERVLTEHKTITTPTLDDLLQADRWARREVNRCLTC
ncbi:MAG: 1-deoxy-D-xylulose-5-phosphate reductoisomerase [Phycisphaerae bacterium]